MANEGGRSGADGGSGTDSGSRMDGAHEGRRFDDEGDAGLIERPDKYQIGVILGFLTLFLVLVSVALVLARPAPQSAVTIASGTKEGAYASFAAQYAEIMARDGIDVTVIHTKGTVDNLALLNDPESGVDVALVQGGVAKDPDATGLIGLGSVYFEPLWVFTRTPEPIGRLGDLAGKRLAVGPVGSGNRAIAIELLRSVDLPESAVILDDALGSAAVAALFEGTIDAAFFVATPYAPWLKDMMRSPEISLMSFERAEAFTRNFRYLSRLEVPQGAMDLAEDLPTSDVTLVSPAATLVAKPDFHPAISDLLLVAAEEVHGRGRLLEERGQFPSPAYVDFPLSGEAERFYERGPGFWRRFLPFWAANLIDRFIVFAIPLAALALPLFRLVVPTYRWQIRRKIYKLYKRLSNIERRITDEADAPALASVLADLETLQADAAGVNVPAAFSNELYHLRLHADFLGNLIRRRQESLEGASTA
ncbi:MAG: TAXI family TRAP transporter solute-binding subunit [Pseudomonadota bacterium]